MQEFDGILHSQHGMCMTEHPEENPQAFMVLMNILKAAYFRVTRRCSR